MLTGTVCRGRELTLTHATSTGSRRAISNIPFWNLAGLMRDGWCVMRTPSKLQNEADRRLTYCEVFNVVQLKSSDIWDILHTVSACFSAHVLLLPFYRRELSQFHNQMTKRLHIWYFSTESFLFSMRHPSWLMIDSFLPWCNRTSPDESRWHLHRYYGVLQNMVPFSCVVWSSSALLIALASKEKG
jgi:hypothetical protein